MGKKTNSLSDMVPELRLQLTYGRGAEAEIEQRLGEYGNFTAKDTGENAAGWRSKAHSQKLSKKGTVPRE